MVTSAARVWNRLPFFQLFAVFKESSSKFVRGESADFTRLERLELYGTPFPVTIPQAL